MDVVKIEFEEGYLILTDDNMQKTKYRFNTLIPVATPATPVIASLTTSLGDDNDLTFTAKTAGTWGNGVSVEYIDPEEAEEPLAIVVEGLAIKVYLETDDSEPPEIVTTAAEIIAAIEADDEADALVDVIAANGDTGVVTAMVEDFLEGGIDGIPAEQGAVRIDDDCLYVNIDDSTTAVSNWKKIALADLEE